MMKKLNKNDFLLIQIDVSFANAWKNLIGWVEPASFASRNMKRDVFFSFRNVQISTETRSEASIFC